MIGEKGRVHGRERENDKKKKDGKERTLYGKNESLGRKEKEKNRKREKAVFL